MDDIVRDVNDGWNDEDPTRPNGMQFKGSDDYLRTKVCHDFPSFNCTFVINLLGDSSKNTSLLHWLLSGIATLWPRVR